MSFRKVFSAFLVLGLLLGLACGGAEEATPTPTTAAPGPAATATPTPTPTADQPVYGGHLRFPHYIRTIDLGQTGSHQWGDFGTSSNLFSGILRFSITDRVTVEGDMAESWEVSDDALTYKFNIIDGIVDHDGEPFGAEEIAYMIYRYTTRPNGFLARRQTCWQTALKETPQWPPQRPG